MSGFRALGTFCGALGGIAAAVAGSIAIAPFLPVVAAVGAGVVLTGVGGTVGGVIGHESPAHGIMLLIAEIPVVREVAVGTHATTAGTHAAMVAARIVV